VAGAEREAAADSAPGAAVRFGEFEFCRDSGTLTRSGEGGSAERLAPKPAALLAMLLERRGELVSRQEIRERLWGDVTVDFENSLNYCIRQVRQALDDSATSPRYVETVPGRGYRLRPQLFAAEVVARPATLSRRVWLAAAVGAAAIGAAGWLLARRDDRPARLRIAILPFSDPTMSPSLALRCRQLEARVLADLTDRGRAFADVVGPRTTGPLVEEGQGLRDIAAALGAHHVVNARIIGETPRAEILFELIRSADGAHVYARRVSDLTSVDAVAEMLVARMLAVLEAEHAGS
jgi:DNA-binding winged helix-turn-helix (wHTH) protein/TolB-like protein